MAWLTEAVVSDGVAKLFRLDGKVALVTGASSGLGARFVKVLANVGANVVACARRIELLEKLAEGFDNVLPVQSDVTDADDRRRMVQAAVDRFGGLDILVNNAGITGETVVPAENETPEGFHSLLHVNLESSFALSTLAFRELQKNGTGSVINIASILGLVSSAPFNQVGYCASKAGLIGMTRDMAVQWAKKGVRVNAIAPGYFSSEGTQRLLDDDRARQRIERDTPMGRVGDEDELDGAIVYLAAAASSYVTGHVLVVDGGWTSR